MNTKQDFGRRWRYLFIVVGLSAGIGASSMAFAGLPAATIPPKTMGHQPPQPSGKVAAKSSSRIEGPRASAAVPLAGDEQLRPPMGSSLIGRPDTPATVLYDQYDNPSVSAVTSQDFEAAYDQYDSQGADDFVVPAGQTWLVDEVDVDGVYLGGGFADSANIIFYDTAGLVPGAPVYTATNVVPVSGLSTGRFVISLDQPATLTAGAYWVSVQANERFNPNGQWFWRNRLELSNDMAAWHNPGGGFGNFACTGAWGRRSFECDISAEAPDQVFRLVGSVPTTPTETPTGTPPTATSTATPSPVNTGSPTATNTVLATVPGPVVTALATVIRDTPTPQPTCGAFWRTVDSPNPGDQGNTLYDVASISGADAWAVGVYWIDGSYQQNLTMHWDGSDWTSVPLPTEVANGTLYGVAAPASNDVWAVGNTTPDGTQFAALVVHWDGSTWTHVTLPGVPASSTLNDVTVISPNDVWAVGSGYNDQAQMQTLTVHWDGISWSVVSSPNVSDSDWLNGVSGDDPKDVWAVGAAWTEPFQQTLTMHWDGGQWSIVPSLVKGDSAQLYAVTTLAPNDAWAVGFFFYDFFDYSTLTLHWDGTSWNFVSSPYPDFDSDFYGVVAVAPNEVWAVGNSYFYNGSGYIPRTLSARWDGSAWVSVSTVDPGTVNTLRSVAIISPGQFVGRGLDRQRHPCRTLWRSLRDTCTDSDGHPAYSNSHAHEDTEPYAHQDGDGHLYAYEYFTPTSTFTPTGTETSIFTSTLPRAATSTAIATDTVTPSYSPTRTPAHTCRLRQPNRQADLHTH